MLDEALLSINQVTVMRQWSLRQTIEGLARHGLQGISVWRDKLHEIELRDAARLLGDHGMTVSGLCFAGLITSPDRTEAAAAMEDVRRAIDEAAALKARCLVFVAGWMVAFARHAAAQRIASLCVFVVMGLGLTAYFWSRVLYTYRATNAKFDLNLFR